MAIKDEDTFFGIGIAGLERSSWGSPVEVLASLSGQAVIAGDCVPDPDQQEESRESYADSNAGKEGRGGLLAGECALV